MTFSDPEPELSTVSTLTSTRSAGPLCCSVNSFALLVLPILITVFALPVDNPDIVNSEAVPLYFSSSPF